MDLKSARLMVYLAASLYDKGYQGLKWRIRETKYQRGVHLQKPQRKYDRIQERVG